MKIFFLSFLGIFTALSLSVATPSPAESSPEPTPFGIKPQYQPSGEQDNQPELRAKIFSPSPSPSASAQPSASSFNSPSHWAKDNEAALRAKTLELAGAFSNDGYKIRDGFWFSSLPPIGQFSLLAVNLFAGNQYWFCAAAASPAQRIVLKLYNESGHPVSTQSYEKDSTLALGAEPSNSGKYYLSIQLIEGSPGNFCVLYTYK